ncbi:MAG: tetratricopeptide repeat protein, partial [Limisphaerales bacterium]
FSARLIGNWITYETPVTNICAFAEKMYLRHDFKKFQGDPKFIRDDNGQKAFSKLRSSIAGIYSWRLGLMENECPPAYRPKNSAEQQRLARETEFAFKQAFAFCPYSPEAVYRYVRFLTAQGRMDDAIAVAETCQRLDPANGQIESVVLQLKNNRNGAAPQSMNLQTAFSEIAKLIQAKQTNQALSLLDQILNSPNADPNVILAVARAYVQLGNTARLEAALLRLVKLVPDNPEAWYDLAGLEAIMGKTPAALEGLQKAIQLSNARLAQNPKSKNLAQEALNDARFATLRQNPDFQKIVSQK